MPGSPSPPTEPTLPGVGGDDAPGDAPDGAGGRDERAVSPAPSAVPAREARTGGVLVIGGAGFIGSHLVDRLIAEGRSVDVVDDLSTGSLGNLAAARTEASRLEVGELHIHTLDACSDDLGTLIALRRPREIFHLALVTRHDESA